MSDEIHVVEAKSIEQAHGAKLLFKSVSVPNYAPPVYGLLICEDGCEYLGHIEAVSWMLATPHAVVALRGTRKGRTQALRDMLDALRNIHYFYDNLTCKKIIYTDFGLKLNCRLLEEDEKEKAEIEAERESSDTIRQL